MTEEQVRKLARKHMKPFAKKRKGSTGFTAWCRAFNVNKGHASDFMNGKKGPGSDLLGALGLQVSYEYKS